MILSIYRVTDQIIYVKDPPPLLREKFCITTDSSALENLSSRLNSIRNTSLDVTSILSEGTPLHFHNLHKTIFNGNHYFTCSANGNSLQLRRPPSASNKHYSLSIEAPINKVSEINKCQTDEKLWIVGYQHYCGSSGKSTKLYSTGFGQGKITS